MQKLPRGRHTLDRAAVVASQKERLCWAAFEVIARRGYRAASVAAIIDRAGISRRTFYELFTDKEACFQAACDFFIDRMKTDLQQRSVGMPTLDWKDLVRSSLEIYLAGLAENPTAAIALHVETLVAGRELAAQRAQVQEFLADRMRRAHHLAYAQDPSVRGTPDGVYDFLIGGIDDRIRHCLHTRGAEQLPSLLPLLHHSTLALLGVSAIETGIQLGSNL